MPRTGGDVRGAIPLVVAEVSVMATVRACQGRWRVATDAVVPITNVPLRVAARVAVGSHPPRSHVR